MEVKNKCNLCDVEFKGFGNNPYPLREKGTCCDGCNITKVVPERMKMIPNYTAEDTWWGEDEDMKFNPNKYFVFNGEDVISPFCASGQLYISRNPYEDYGLTDDEMNEIFGEEYLAWLEEMGDAIITDEDMENGIPEPTESKMRLHIYKNSDNQFVKKWKMTKI